MDRRISPTQKNTRLHKLCVLINWVQFNSLQTLSVSQFLTQRNCNRQYFMNDLWFALTAVQSEVFSLETLPEGQTCVPGVFNSSE